VFPLVTAARVSRLGTDFVDFGNGLVPKLDKMP
jgi:hypothetical protein